MIPKVHKSTRFEKKLDSIIWTIILFLPVIIYLFSYSMLYRGGSGIEIVTFNTFISQFRFNFVFDILINVFGDVFNNTFLDNSLFSFISYWVLVEIVHVFFDVIVFIPRFAHCIGERLYPND